MINLNSRMAVWLIRIAALFSSNILRRDTIFATIVNALLLTSISIIVVVRIRYTLVSTSRNKLLLIRTLPLVRRMVGSAAASAEHPEQSSGKRESNGNPSNSQKAGVDRSLNAEIFSCGFDGSSSDAGLDCSHDRSNDDGGGCDGRYDRCEAGADARADGEDTKDELEDADDNGDQVDYLCPFGERDERLQRSLQLLGKSDGHATISSSGFFDQGGVKR